MIKRIRMLWLALAVVWPSCQALPAAELRLEKVGGTVAVTAPGAADIAVVPVGEGRWAIVLAMGDPPRVEILYLRQEDAPIPPSPLVPEPTRLAREWLGLAAPQARSRAAALAQAFREVAAEIENGKLKDPAAIIQASTERNRASLGEDRNAWLPWFEKLREYMNTLADKGGLKTAADHAVFFRQIADGLAGEEKP